jgi:hypothetical protein
MQVLIESVTPEIAKRYLANNQLNRSLRKLLVNQYANDMKNGTWRLTHQGLAFSASGQLLDGQHRLAAIVQSGVTVQMLVTRGVEMDTQLVMDDHARRSAGDALTFLRGERVTATDVATMRAAIELQPGMLYKGGRSKTELSHCLDVFREAIQFVRPFANRHGDGRGVRSAPVMGAIAIAWFYAPDLDRLQRFAAVVSGDEMAANDGERIAQILREWLLKTGVRHSYQRVEAFGKTQRAIAAFLKGERLERLYAASGQYPWPLVKPVRQPVTAAMSIMEAK